MKKLEPIKCPVHRHLTPLEAINKLAERVQENTDDIDTLGYKVGALYYVYYSNDFYGVGGYSHIYKDADCTIHVSYEELLKVCETHEFIRVKNGTRYYTTIGYAIEENRISLIFPYSMWEESNGDGTTSLIGGFPSISRYTDGKGNTYDYWNVKNSVPV